MNTFSKGNLDHIEPWMPRKILFTKCAGTKWTQFEAMLDWPFVYIHDTSTKIIWKRHNMVYRIYASWIGLNTALYIYIYIYIYTVPFHISLSNLGTNIYLTPFWYTNHGYLVRYFTCELILANCLFSLSRTASVLTDRVDRLPKMSKYRFHAVFISSRCCVRIVI